LAAVCVAALIAARWRHEQQVAGSGQELPDLPELRTWLERLERRPAAARAGLGGGPSLRRRTPSLAYPLYWLGLTTSAALAAQSISVLVAGMW
jgi:hypothetical protein